MMPAGSWRRIRNGYEAAFETLTDGFHRLVYSIAQRMLADPMAAQDLTQAVSRKIRPTPMDLGRQTSSTGLRAAAEPRSLDVLRAPSARPESEAPVDLGSEDDLDDAVFAKIQGERVRAALFALPEEQRKPIEMGFFAA